MKTTMPIIISMFFGDNVSLGVELVRCAMGLALAAFVIFVFARPTE